MAKKKQILFLLPKRPAFPESSNGPRSPSPKHQELDIFRHLDMIAELARRRVHGNGGKENEMDS
jgi:hypothetical protein